MTSAPPGNRFGFKDLGIGIGLRTVHYPHILSTWPKIDWFDVLSENYLYTGRRPAYLLYQWAERYPLSPPAAFPLSLSV